jgi:hypothetical protein
MKEEKSMMTLFHEQESETLLMLWNDKKKTKLPGIRNPSRSSI